MIGRMSSSINFRQFFFSSTGRCGTDFLRTILKLDENTDVYHEPIPKLGFASKYAFEQRADADAMALAILASRFEYLSTSFLLGREYVETNNRMTFFAPGLLSLFPSARFVFITRHPGAFVRSGIRRGYYNDSEGKLLNRKITVDGASSMSQIEKVAKLWNDTNQYIEDFVMNVPRNQVLRLKAEDCFSDVLVLGNLSEFVTRKTANFRAIEVKMRTPQNIQIQGDFPGYSEWTGEMREQLASAATLASKYGLRIRLIRCASKDAALHTNTA